MDLGQNLVYASLLIVFLESMAPSWAIFDALADQIFTLA